MQRQQVAEDDDFAARGALGERCGDQIWRRHQAVDILVMLVQHHAVKAELVGISQLIDIFLIQASCFCVIPKTIGHRYPAGVFLLIEIFVQIRISHEMPAKELDRFHRSPRKAAVSHSRTLSQAKIRSNYNFNFRLNATNCDLCWRYESMNGLN